MTRELFVGPLCRFFAGDAAEAVARRDGVLAWRTELNASLEGRLRAALDWDEDPRAEPAWFDVGPRGLDAVRLLAVYADRPELELPDTLPDPLELDAAWSAAAAGDFARSRYGQLLAASIWLPGEFDFTFRCPRPDGVDATFGSLQVLRDQLGFLNARTFAASDAVLEGWVGDPGTGFVARARRGLAASTIACRAARSRAAPLVVPG